MSGYSRLSSSHKCIAQLGESRLLIGGWTELTCISLPSLSPILSLQFPKQWVKHLCPFNSISFLYSLSDQGVFLYDFDRKASIQLQTKKADSPIIQIFVLGVDQSVMVMRETAIEIFNGQNLGFVGTFSIENKGFSGLIRGIHKGHRALIADNQGGIYIVWMEGDRVKYDLLGTVDAPLSLGVSVEERKVFVGCKGKIEVFDVFEAGKIGSFDVGDQQVEFVQPDDNELSIVYLSPKGFMSLSTLSGQSTPHPVEPLSTSALNGSAAQPPSDAKGLSRVLSQPGLRGSKAYTVRIDDQPYIVFICEFSLWLCQSKDPSAPQPLSQSLCVLSLKHSALAEALEAKRQLNGSTLDLESRNFEKAERTSNENYSGRLNFARSLALKTKESLDKYLSERDKPRKCIVCFDNEKSVIFQDCNHLAVCSSCAGSNLFPTCVICRKPVRGRFEAVLVENSENYDAYFEGLL